MSGFSVDWLSLREGADHRSRDPSLLAALSSTFDGREEIDVVDLGCGSGSNLRALAAHLPARQNWRLVDHDAGLLAAARETIAEWADEARRDGDNLEAEKDGKRLRVSFVQADLARDLEAVLDPAPALVTAAALFDLCSREWIAGFAAVVAARGAAFYTALTYDGREIWEPPHPADAAVLAAFHAHQEGDKGFGFSAGPQATQGLAAAFAMAGYRVETGESPWRLGAADAGLIAALANGAALAVAETGRVPAADVEDWLAARVAPGVACVIGHVDLLARPA
ncbi:MAG: class I SAM-dependent methyltransferase [Salinarimonadaceae bacterium]|nr:MAG: class I SAM-dependent methyltransferase [Salinarimonadaceae bacterium]